MLYPDKNMVLFCLFAIVFVNSQGTNKVSSYDDLVKPCLNDLVSHLIHHQDAEGHILYEARQSFELTPRRFKAVVEKAKIALAKARTSRAAADLDDQRRFGLFNRLGNLLFGHFYIAEDRLHLGPVKARIRPMR